MNTQNVNFIRSSSFTKSTRLIYNDVTANYVDLGWLLICLCSMLMGGWAEGQAFTKSTRLEWCHNQLGWFGLIAYILGFYSIDVWVKLASYINVHLIMKSSEILYLVEYPILSWFNKACIHFSSKRPKIGTAIYTERDGLLYFFTFKLPPSF